MRNLKNKINDIEFFNLSNVIDLEVRKIRFVFVLLLPLNLITFFFLKKSFFFSYLFVWRVDLVTKKNLNFVFFFSLPIISTIWLITD